MDLARLTRLPGRLPRMAWDPDTYLTFADHRLRPAVDLLARVPLAPQDVATVVDLGAGSGNLVPLLRDRFPGAHVTAVDADPAMVDRARADLTTPDTTVVHADVATWAPAQPVDLVFSNAALHWIDDHEALLPRLLRQVRPGGALAVQMPRNHDAPSHRGLAAVVREGPWAEVLVPLLREHPVAPPWDQHRLLAPHAQHLDAWSTTYVQRLAPLPGPVGDHEVVHPVAAWLLGSTLRPLLAALDEAMRPDFLGAFEDRMADAYPLEPDGSASFPFTRTFLVAVPSG